MREQFYRRCLSISKSDKPWIPNSWVYRSSLQACADALPQTLHADPVSFFQSPSDDLSLAGLCLDYYVVYHYEKLQSRQEVRERFIRDQAGKRALLWILQPSTYDKYDLQEHPRFLRAIAHLLAAKGLYREILGWLRHTRVPKVLQHIDFRHPRAWKGVLLHDVVESASFWNNDGIGSGLKLFYGVMDQHNMRSTDPAYTPIPKALCWLREKFAWKGFKPGKVSPTLYDRLMKDSAWVDKSLGGDFERTVMALNLPVHPRVDEGVAFIVALVNAPPGNPFIEDLTSPKGPKSYVLYFIRRLARFLDERQMAKEARQLLDYSVDTFPLLWRNDQEVRRGQHLFRPDETSTESNKRAARSLPEKGARIYAARQEMFATLERSRFVKDETGSIGHKAKK